MIFSNQSLADEANLSSALHLDQTTTHPNQGSHPAGLSHHQGTSADTTGDDADHSQNDTVIISAVGPSWLRVFSRSGSILFEGTIGAGDGIALRDQGQGLMLMSGNPNVIFFWIEDEVFGPAGPRRTVVRDASLLTNDIQGSYDLVPVEDLSAQHRLALERARERYGELTPVHGLTEPAQ